MIVMKFGGTSLRDATRIKEVVEIIRYRLDKDPVVVLSAMGKTTDNLITAGQNALNGKPNIEDIRRLHYRTIEELGLDRKIVQDLLDELNDLLAGISLLKELSPRTHDFRVSFGERLSVRIFAAYMKKIGVNSEFHDAFDIGFVTDANHINATVLDEIYENIGSKMKDFDHLPIITGFIAKNKKGDITTLGRGGSDLTASILGVALKADEIQVWKDVDGILTTDPRIVPEAIPVPKVSFEEASELAYFGAKVLHPISIKPAMDHKIPVRVKNSYNQRHPGTVICSSFEDDSLLRAITHKDNVTIVDIVSTRMLGQYGFLAKVFNVFNEQEISVDMVATSEVSVSLTLNNSRDYTELKQALEEFSYVDIKEKKAIVSIVGNVHRSTEILDKVFDVFRKNDIQIKMMSQGASKVNIGFVVDEEQVRNCVSELHKEFFARDKR